MDPCNRFEEGDCQRVVFQSRSNNIDKSIYGRVTSVHQKLCGSNQLHSASQKSPNVETDGTMEVVEETSGVRRKEIEVRFSAPEQTEECTYLAGLKVSVVIFSTF
ncbi:hypothetical protein AB6A40_010705 [Gnathostoma spinigerum]|uniref:Uncharacterized protein n=1 Tax=Gnathostoma spinigerum TaxID=75299 RepID=A0ABD6F1N2_9BILA